MKYCAAFRTQHLTSLLALIAVHLSRERRLAGLLLCAVCSSWLRLLRDWAGGVLACLRLVLLLGSIVAAWVLAASAAWLLLRKLAGLLGLRLCGLLLLGLRTDKNGHAWKTTYFAAVTCRKVRNPKIRVSPSWQH